MIGVHAHSWRWINTNQQVASQLASWFVPLTPEEIAVIAPSVQKSQVEGEGLKLPNGATNEILSRSKILGIDKAT